MKGRKKITITRRWRKDETERDAGDSEEKKGEKNKIKKGYEERESWKRLKTEKVKRQQVLKVTQ